MKILFILLCTASLITGCGKKEKKHSSRCLYDHSIFAETALNAAKDEQQLASFKRNPFFNLLWENHSYEEGQQWLQKIKKESSFLKEKFRDFRQIDQIGNPRIYNFGEDGNFSPSTLRLIAMTGELQEKLGTFAPGHIIQIGAGCGSWCKILNDVYSFKSYTIVDLPEQLSLAKKCLEKMEVKNVKFFTPEELPKGMVYDLIISDMSFSEFDRPYQKLFFERVLSCSSFGYILGYEFPKHYGVVSMNLDELKAKFNEIGKQTNVQELSNDRNHYIIYWR